MKAIVTVKLPRNRNHKPWDKQTGQCPINDETLCTDITGSHHSYIETGVSKESIRLNAKAKWKHVTRIEVIEE